MEQALLPSAKRVTCNATSSSSLWQAIFNYEEINLPQTESVLPMTVVGK